MVNLIGALGPELAFDALWYHLTLPKLYLLMGAIRHIPGGLLYYSDMPKLGEMLYTLALSLQGEVLAKVFHLLFGALIAGAIYAVSRRHFSKTVALLTAMIFYANLVVAWESTTAYVDLIRTFFEFLALWSFLLWDESKKKKYFLLSALFVGAAVTTKLLALPSICIFALLIIGLGVQEHASVFTLLKRLALFTGVSLIVPLPWFIFSYLNTGNPLYPVFSPLYKTAYHISLINPVNFILDFLHVLLYSADPLNPLYLIVLPLTLLYVRSMSRPLKIVAIYSFLGFMAWYVLPHTGGGRFILAYIPAFSILAGAVLEHVSKQRLVWWTVVSCALFIAVVTVLYRGVANARYLPVVVGQESKAAFLSAHLNFTYGDFYDTDSYFKTHIKQSDVVLLYGFHNLYYVNFPFIDASWVKKGDSFDYIATQHVLPPKRFNALHLVHYDAKTFVSVYKGKGWMTY